jgi:hypothetical protein
MVTRVRAAVHLKTLKKLIERGTGRGVFGTG